MLKKSVSIWLIVVILGLTILTGCTAKEDESTTVWAGDNYKVAMLFESRIADAGFNLSCLRGAEEAKSQLDIGLTICEAFSVSEAAYLLDNLAESCHYDLIICTGFSQSYAVQETAGKYPDQRFALVDGDIADIENVASLLSRDEESSFLVGALAATMTKTGIIGFIGGMEQPSIQRFLAGYLAGAQYVNPDCVVLVSYSGNWLNDGTTRELCLQQFEEGADVFFGAAGAGSIGIIVAAEEHGLYAIGVDNDQSYLAPQTVIASTLKNVEVSVFENINSAVAGEFAGGIQSVGLVENGVGIIFNNDLISVTNEIKENIKEIQDKIISGEITVPYE